MTKKKNNLTIILLFPKQDLSAIESTIELNLTQGI